MYKKLWFNVVLFFCISLFAKPVYAQAQFPSGEEVYELNNELISAYVTELDMNKAHIDNFDKFAVELGRFGDLKRIELCDTNLNYDQLCYLRDKYPKVKVVWSVTFCNTWTVKTDAVAFSTNKAHHNPAIKDNEIWKLKYCTDLVALDIGHNEVTDISFLEYMPNLKILILVDNWIRDLTPIKYCKKLTYLETFVNPITDISPLAELKELSDVNICYNYFNDNSALMDMPNLERLFISHTCMTMKQINELKEVYPNVKIEYQIAQSVHGGWRESPKYFAMREMFMTNTIHPLFADVDPETASDIEATEEGERQEAVASLVNGEQIIMDDSTPTAAGF